MGGGTCLLCVVTGLLPFLWCVLNRYMCLMLLRGGECHNSLIPFPLSVFLPKGRWRITAVSLRERIRMSLMRWNHAQSYDSLLLQSYDSFSVFFLSSLGSCLCLRLLRLFSCNAPSSYKAFHLTICFFYILHTATGHRMWPPGRSDGVHASV